jgi:MFS family permease
MLSSTTKKSWLGGGLMATQFSAKEGMPWKAHFFTIWGGQAVSILGSQLVQFALIWYLTVETGSATVLATASLVGMLPNVILGPFVGTLVDRWNRRRIMVIADSIVSLATLVLAGLFALDAVAIWHIYVVMLVRALASSFHGNAMAASTSLMVPVEHLTRIQGINEMLNGGLNVVAAPLGALLLSVLPIQGILAIDVSTALLAILPLCFIQIPQPEHRAQGEGQRKAKTTVWQDFVAGFRYMLGWPGLLIIGLMTVGINLMLMPAFSLLPLLVKDYFGGGAIQLGWVESAMGVGIVLGGAILGVWGGFERKIIDVYDWVDGIGSRHPAPGAGAFLCHSPGHRRGAALWDHESHHHGAVLCRHPINRRARYAGTHLFHHEQCGHGHGATWPPGRRSGGRPVRDPTLVLARGIVMYSDGRGRPVCTGRNEHRGGSPRDARSSE